MGAISSMGGHFLMYQKKGVDEMHTDVLFACLIQRHHHTAGLQIYSALHPFVLQSVWNMKTNRSRFK